MRIGIDIMGGDFAPKKTVHGAVLAFEELPKDVESIICEPIKVNNVKKMKMIKRGIKSLIKNPSINLPSVPEFSALRVKFFLYLYPSIPFP